MKLDNEKNFYEELREICLKYQVGMIFTGNHRNDSLISTIITVDTTPKIWDTVSVLRGKPRFEKLKL